MEIHSDSFTAPLPQTQSGDAIGADVQDEIIHTGAG